MPVGAVLTGNRFRYAVTLLVAMACMIWWVMPMNGVLTGMGKTTMAIHLLRTRKGRVRGVTVFCGVVLGMPLPTPCVWLTATTTIQRLPSTTSDFVVCQDSLLRSSRLTLVRAMHDIYCFTIVWLFCI